MVGLLKAPIHSLGNMIERRGRPTKGPDALSGTVVRSTTAGQNIQLLREQKDFDFTVGSLCLLSVESSACQIPIKGPIHYQTKSYDPISCYGKLSAADR